MPSPDEPVLAIDFDHCDAIIVDRTHGQVEQAYRAYDNDRRFCGYGDTPEEAVNNMIKSGRDTLDQIQEATEHHFNTQTAGERDANSELPPLFSNPVQMFWHFKHAVSQLKWIKPAELQRLFNEKPVSVVSKRTSTHLRKAQAFERWVCKDGIVESSNVTSLFTFESGDTLETQLAFLVNDQPRVIRYLNHTVNPK